MSRRMRALAGRVPECCRGTVSDGTIPGWTIGFTTIVSTAKTCRYPGSDLFTSLLLKRVRWLAQYAGQQRRESEKANGVRFSLGCMPC